MGNNAIPEGKGAYDVEVTFGGKTYTVGTVYVGINDTARSVQSALASILEETAANVRRQGAGDE